MSNLFVPPGSYKHWHHTMNVIPLGNLFHLVKLLARIVMSNLFPIDHHSDLGVARARFIYALLMDVQVDFASIAISLMKAMFFESSVSLLYGSLISRIISKFVKIPEIEPTVKPLDPFYQATVRRSNAQMRVRGTEEMLDTDNIADNPGPSGGPTTSSHVSLMM